MPEPFDPYSELLGIEKAKRPPDHYALLGLKLYESDVAKIEDAATERMSRLQDLANSDLMDHSQRLLNELSAARRCLLNPVQKVAYDETLRTKLQRASSSSGESPAQSKAARKKRQIVLLGVALVVLLIVAAITFLWRGRTTDNANLIVDWPLDQRKGAALLVDSIPTPVPEEDPARIAVPPGRHKIVFRRAGYREITQTMEISALPRHVKLRWIPERR